MNEMSEFGNAENDGRYEIVLCNRLEEIERLHMFLDRIASESDWTQRTLHHLTLACEELLTNTISYGYPNGGDDRILFLLEAGETSVKVVIEDAAEPYDPFARTEPDVSLELDDRAIGGLGVFLVQQLMDEVAYEPKAGGNRMRLRLNLANRM